MYGFVSYAFGELLKWIAGQKTDFESWIDRTIADLLSQGKLDLPQLKAVKVLE